MKVLESLENKHLSNFLSANNLLSPFQSGFRRGDSAPLQLFRLTTELFTALDSRVVTAAVFYDFKKAFDSVWRRALIGKLFCAGVSGSALEWLSDVVTDRTQHVHVGDSLSDPGSPTAGVPQGSPLSPTLFILFINSVTSSTSCPTNCFADDTCTITPGLPLIHHRSTKDPVRHHSSSRLGKRSQAHYPSREDCLHAVSPPTPLSAEPPYLSKQSCHHPSPPAYISTLALTFSHPFLVTPCRSAFLSLFCNAWSSSSSSLLLPFSSRCLPKVYLCYIRPLLEYGCSSFTGLSVRSARQLEAVQQKALSICSVDSACISSLSERHSSILLRLFFSIFDDNVPDHLTSDRMVRFEVEITARMRTGIRSLLNVARWMPSSVVLKRS